MVKKRINSARESGFTIIEVLIVLAIAGLILLIVFLAVPALQRNSRNTQYRNEASQLLAASTEFINNNNGTLPVAADNTTIRDLTKNKSITNLNIKVQSGASETETPTLDTAVLKTGAKCEVSASSSYKTKKAATRSLTLVYAIEDKDGNVTAQCTES